MENKRIKWTPQTVDIKLLKPYDKNPRVITEYGLQELKSSFDDIGMCQPIVINTDYTILSGHARWMQLKKDKYYEVSVMVPDRKLTPKQEEAVIIRMNKNIVGTWDFDILANEFNVTELMEYGFQDFELVGMDKLTQVNTGDESAEWVGMPEFEPKEGSHKIIIHFDNPEFREKFAEMLGIDKGKNETLSWSTSWPAKEREDLKSVKYE